MRIQRINDVSIIRDEVEVPGLGALPINAFVIHGEQPILVDTGRPVAKGEFQDALREIIDPKELRWIWLSHPDRDHMGSLFDVLDAAPEARLVSTFMATGYLTVEFDVPLHRGFLLNPGESLDVGGGRKLQAFRPPLYDSPMTVGFFDTLSGYAFSSDCFGAPMPATGSIDLDDISAIPADAVRGAQLTWATADACWVTTVDKQKFERTYDDLRAFNPHTIFSTHLPPAVGQTDTMLDMLSHAPDAQPFVGPNQATLEAMLEAALAVPEQGAAQTESLPG